RGVSPKSAWPQAEITNVLCREWSVAGAHVTPPGDRRSPTIRIASRFFRVSKRKGLGLASTVRDVRQPLHSCALVVRRQMRVLARNRCALVSDNLSCNKVGDTCSLQHRHRAMTQRMERKLACLLRLVAAFACALMSAR